MKSCVRWAQAALLPAFLPTLVHAAVEPPPLDAYGELPHVEDAAITPDGRFVASIVQYKGQRRVLVIDESMNKTFDGITGDAKVRSIEWADNDTILLTHTATVATTRFTASKLEMAGTIILPIKGGGKSGAVFGGSQSILNTTRGQYGIRNIGGKTVGYYGGIKLDTAGLKTQLRDARTTLYAVDIKANIPRVAAEAPDFGYYRDWLIDAAGKVTVTLDVSDDGSWKISAPSKVNSASRIELAHGLNRGGKINLLCFGKDGTTAIYIIEDTEGTTHWYETPLAGGETQEIFANDRLDRIFIDRRNGNLIGYRLDNETMTTLMYDPAQDAALSKTFKAFNGRNPRLIDWTPDFSKVVLRTSGTGDSGTLFLVDVAARRADPLGYERIAIEPEQVGPISMIEYKAADGLAMDGVLTLPPGQEAKNLPVVVLPHGGPASEDRPEFDWWAQAFASRGYAVFQPNFRGSTSQDGAFRHAGDGQWGRKMQTDISDGVAELAKRGIVDPRRACIVGASYGGYAALAGVTLQQRLYRCAVSVAGVSDIRVMYDTELRQSGQSHMLRANLREQLGNPAGFNDVSPRRFAAKADAPVLLIHGKDDTVVPYQQSTMMADALKDAGKPYEMVTLPGEDHWLSREDTRKRMLAETMRFVQKYNPAGG